jgi:hypothetical protein
MSMDSGFCRQWILHIFEFKRTVNTKNWGEMKKQYKGAFLRTAAIASCLDITIKDIILHSCYRDDKISSLHEAIQIRITNSDVESRNLFLSWKSRQVKLDVFEGIVGKNDKINLDENGFGEVRL